MQLGTSAIPFLPAVAVGVAVLLVVLECWGVSRARRAPATADRSAPAGDEGDGPSAEDWTGEAAGGAADPPPPARRTTVADAVAARRADTSPFPPVPQEHTDDDEFAHGLLPVTDPGPDRPDDVRDPADRVATDRAAAVPEADRTAVVPVVERAAAVPEADRTAAVPEADQAAAVPVADRTPAVPDAERTPTGSTADPAPDAPADVRTSTVPVVDRVPDTPTEQVPAVPAGGPSATDGARTGPATASDAEPVAAGMPIAPGGSARPTPRHALQRATDGTRSEETGAPGRPGPGPRHASAGAGVAPGRPPVHDPWAVPAEPDDPWAAPAAPHPTAALAVPDSTADARTGPAPGPTAARTEPAATADAGTGPAPGPTASRVEPDATADAGTGPAPGPTASRVEPDATADAGTGPAPRPTEPDATADERTEPTEAPGPPPAAEQAAEVTTPEDDAAQASVPDPSARWTAGDGSPVPAGDGVRDTEASGTPAALPDGVVPETAEDADGLASPAPDPVEPGPVPPPWSAARSDPEAARAAEPAPPISVAVQQALAAREMQRARGVLPDGVGTTSDAPTPDARDRLLSVLLSDPVTALGAATELDDTRARIDRLGDVLRRRRADLATAVHRLHASGLSGEQIGRLSGLADDDVRAILGHSTEEDVAER